MTITDVLYFISKSFETSWYLICLFIILSIYYAIYYVSLKFRRDPRLEKFSKTLPGPDGLPLVGSSLQFAFNGLGNIHEVFSHYSEEYGSLYKFWIGTDLVIGLSDCQHLETVFRSSKTLAKPAEMFCGFFEFFGNSLFSAPVSVWRQTRKTLQPLFGKKAIKSQLPLFNKYISSVVKELQCHEGGPEFNIKDYTVNMVTNSFLESHYNVHLSAEEQKYFNFNEMFKIFGAYAFSKLLLPWMRVNFIAKLFCGNLITIHVKKLKDFFNLLQFLPSSPIENHWNENDMDSEKNSTKSFLTTIGQLEAEMKLENYAYDETMNFILAAADTTSSTLSFCLLMIAMHPDVQNNLCNELNAVFGDDDRPASMEDLHKLVYLDQVIKETERRFTLIPNIFREVEEDIKIGSMMIPARTVIMIRIKDVHMNPKLYPNPLQFNPENFSAAAVSQRSKFSFLALGAGTRDCIGKYMAETITKLAVTNILRNFKLDTTTQMEDISYSSGSITVKISSEFCLSIKNRTKRTVDAIR